MQVKDIPADFIFVSNSQDVEPLNEEFNTDYDSFFVQVGDGEYTGVYGMSGIVPYNIRSVDKVL
jgi:hypothetical protein